jgi:protein-tyrosine-phosphatase/predicted ATP-grasp superfamily ATP-dependent carboligase
VTTALSTPAQKPRVLVLDGHSRAAVETVQALGRAGIVVDVCSERSESLAFQSRYARRCFHQPSSVDVEEFTVWLRLMDEEGDYALIVPSTETSLIGLNSLPETNPLRVKAVVPSKRALDVSLDKHRTWELARRLGVRVPDGVLIHSVDELPPAESFPVVLKPIRSKVNLGERIFTLEVAIVHSEKKRIAYLRTWLPHTPVLQQSYVRGQGIGVALLYDRGRKVWHFAHERIHELPLSGGASSYRKSIAAGGELLAASETLMDALQWHGVAMVEYKRRPDGSYCLMEINPRLWGSLALAIDAGVNFPLGLLSVAQAQPAPSQPPFRRSYYTRSIKDDLYWLRSNFAADRNDPILLTRPRLRSCLELLRPLIGRESWDHFDVHDLRVTRTVMGQIWSRYAGGLGLRLRRKVLARKAAEHHRKLLERGLPRPGGGTILFICYGNICRSPFAEELARTKLPGYQLSSAGFHATAGRQSPLDFQSIATSFGIELGERRSARVTWRQVAEADLILAMDVANYEQLVREFPEARGRTTLLGLFAPQPFATIDDPYHAAEAEVRQTLEQICVAVDGLAASLTSNMPTSLPAASG